MRSTIWKRNIQRDTLFSRYFTSPDLGLNPGRRSGTPATSSLGYSTAHSWFHFRTTNINTYTRPTMATVTQPALRVQHEVSLVCRATACWHYSNPRWDRAIAPAVTRRLPTTEVWIRAHVRSFGICGWQSGTGACFLRILRFPLPILIPPIALHSSCIIRSWYNRPNSDRRAKWTQSVKSPRFELHIPEYSKRHIFHCTQSFGLSQLQQFLLKSYIFWAVKPCSPLKVKRRIGETYTSIFGVEDWGLRIQ
jgi:hypothetical protein